MWFGNRGGWQPAECWMAGKDEVRRLRHGVAGVRVRVGSGCLLVTREGDPQDHVVGPGEELLVAGPGLVVAWALEPSQVTIVEPRPTGAAQVTGAAA